MPFEGNQRQKIVKSNYERESFIFQSDGVSITGYTNKSSLGQ